MPESFRHRSGSRVIDDVSEIRSFFGWTEPLAELYRRRQDLFLELCRKTDIQVLAGAEKVIRDLHGRGLGLAIASSGIGASIEEILERLSLRPYFSAIVAGEDVQRAKPDPEPFLLAASRLAVDPGRCVVFEDSSVGVEGAVRAGMYCVAVRNPHASLRQDLSPAQRIVDSFLELDIDALLAYS